MTYEPHDDETRVTDKWTGGQKGSKITQLGALDPLALIELARVAGYGAEKYAAFNYLKGYDWALSFNAMMRHALLFWNGEKTDPESGLSHMAHAAWMALSLVSFSERGIGTDTRFTLRFCHAHPFGCPNGGVEQECGHLCWERPCEDAVLRAEAKSLAEIGELEEETLAPTGKWTFGKDAETTAETHPLDAEACGKYFPHHHYENNNNQFCIEWARWVATDES